MIHILLALSDNADALEIQSYIPPDYQTDILKPNTLLDWIPQVIITDLTRLQEFTALRRRVNAFTSCLLVITAEELPHLPQTIQTQVDDIILLPCHATELQIRLRSLLRIRDLSERQLIIHKKLAVTDKALESTSDAIIIADNNGVVIYINPAFMTLFGYSVNELNVGGIPDILFRKSTIGNRIFNQVREDGSWKGEVELTQRDNTVAPFLLNIDRINNDDDELLGFIAICTDITQHKRITAIQEEQRLLAMAQLDTAKALTSTLDLTEVFERILENINHVVPNDAANVILITKGNALLVDRNAYSEKDQLERLKSAEVPVHEYDDLRMMLKTDAPLIISNTIAYLDEHTDMQKRTPWLNSHIGMPIRLRDETIGFLNVDSIQPNLFTQEHVERLKIFVEQAAIAIHNARLHERAQQLAMLEERQRLARNLHDAVSQTLFSANLIADAIPGLMESKPDEVLPRLEQVQKLNRGALAEMRTLLLELHPERLLQTGIDQLIKQLADGVLGQSTINVILDVTKQEITLPPNIHVAVYYITHEALNNVTKHAEAEQVIIRLQKHGKQLSLAIIDDGKGFDITQVASTTLGLNSIRERTRATNASFEIHSEIGKGTQISANWSL